MGVTPQLPPPLLYPPKLLQQQFWHARTGRLPWGPTLQVAGLMLLPNNSPTAWLLVLPLNDHLWQAEVSTSGELLVKGWLRSVGGVGMGHGAHGGQGHSSAPCRVHAHAATDVP